MAVDILHTMRDGVEFFTVVKTGESAVSLRGLARMGGIAHTEIRRLLEPGDKTGGKILESLDIADFYLDTNIRRRGGLVTPVRSKVATLILFYCAFERDKDRAKESLKAFVTIGLDSYIQGVTGWLPEDKQSSQDSRNEINRLIKDADPWKQLYSAATCDKVRRWYFPRDFFWKFAYDWMTTEEIQFLNNYNPVDVSSQQRSHRIHQHLSQETRDRLVPEISGLCVLIESATSRQDFETRYNRAKGYDQKEAF